VIAATFSASDGAILVAVLVLIAFSGLLAIAETSLVSTSKARARSLVESGHRSARALERLVNDPEKFLAPVLLLVLVCQLVAATLVGVIASHLFGPFGVVAATLFEIIVIFVAAESIPKHWAVNRADRAALMSAPVVAAVIAFPPLRTLSSFLNGISHFILPADPASQQPDVTESELLALADVAVEADVIEEEERALLSSIIEFGDTVVREVMVPRPDIVAVESKMSTGEVLETAITSGLSRIPIYDESVDDITGVAFTRDLVKAIRRDGESRPVSAYAREARYVPETKRVAPLLREMQRDQFHLAIVVDEYGVTAGVVTLEDLIEELIGEISDEFDTEAPEIETMANGALLVPGQMAIDEVNDVLDPPLPEGDWDTIGGLVFHLRGQVPQDGDRVIAGPYDLIVERVQGSRIRTIRLIKRAPIEPVVEETKE
jgi:CBS domain containing-hemolysin-like protein